MTYRARVKNGALVLDQPLPLDDDTVVDVDVAPVDPSARNPLLDLAGIMNDPSLPKDGALNHDHYLYGAPKK
jgi:hypothetical protein